MKLCIVVTHLLGTGHLRRAPTAFPRDDFVFVGTRRANDQRLNDAFFLNRRCQLVQLLGHECPARLVGVGFQFFNRDFQIRSACIRWNPTFRFRIHIRH